MYSTCLFCTARLGHNDVLPEFPVGIRLAFDAERGRLWVICPSCFRWNLTPIEERWEVIEACERRFRHTRLRFSTDHIGLAYLPEGVALVRIGRALPSEIAAWRYGRHLRRWLPEWTPDPVLRFALRWNAIGRATLDLACRRFLRLRLGYDATTWLRVHLDAVRVVAVARGDDGERAVIRLRHVEQTALLRPDPA